MIKSDQKLTDIMNTERKLVVSNYPYVMDVTKVEKKIFAPDRFRYSYIGSTRRLTYVKKGGIGYYKVGDQIWRFEAKAPTWELFSPELIKEKVERGRRVRLVVGKNGCLEINPDETRIEQLDINRICKPGDVEFEDILHE